MAELSKTTALETGADTLFAEVYDRLKAMASRQRARGGAPGTTLGTTELVHELYLRMGGVGESVLIVHENGTTTVGATSGYFDAIDLRPLGDDTIFADGFEGF